MPNLVQPESSQVTQVNSTVQPAAVLYWRRQVAIRLDWLARLACFCALVLAPLRYRINLQPRPYPPIYGDYTDLLLFASDIPLLAALILWAASLLLWPRRVSLSPLWLSLCLAALTFFSMISILDSPDPIISAFQLLRMLVLDGLYLFVINQFSSLYPLAVAAGLQVVIQAVIGLTQVFRQSSLGLHSLGEHVLDPTQSGVGVVWSALDRSLRAYGLTDHPNILGGCLAFGLLLFAYWLSHTRQKSLSVAQLAGIGVFCLGCQALLLTFSRSAWIALVAGFLLWGGALLRTRSQLNLRRLAGLLSAASLMCLPLVWSFSGYIFPRLNIQQITNTQSNESRSLAERRLLNQAANEIFSQQALTGVGLGVYPLALKEARPEFPIYYQPAHFALLAAASEIGIFGALVYAAMSILPLLVYVVPLIYKPVSPPQNSYTVATALLLAIFVVGWFDYYTWMIAPGRLWQWAVWGIWALAYQQRGTAEVS